MFGPDDLLRHGDAMFDAGFDYACSHFIKACDRSIEAGHDVKECEFMKRAIEGAWKDVKEKRGARDGDNDNTEAE